MKKVILSTINTRVFVQELIALAKQGAELTDKCVTFKTPTLTAELMIDDSVVVKQSPYVRVVPVDRKEDSVDAVVAKPKKATKRKAKKVINQVEEKQEEVAEEKPEKEST